jgi:hypothetical protein
MTSSPQAKVYVGVKHSVTQKETELRGQAHRQLPNKLVLNQFPIMNGNHTSKRLVPSETENVLIPES